MGGDSLRVLLLNWRDTGHPEGGGAETHLERIAGGLREAGHHVQVRCARYPGAPTREVVDGVHVVRRGGRFTVYLHTALALARQRRRWDVVVDVQNGMPFWSPLFTRAPVVNLTHHLHREQWRVIFGPALGRVGWWLESRVAPRVYRRCRYVTVSQATRTDLGRLGIGPARVSVVYSGMDAPVLPLDADAWPRSATPSLVVLGRLVPHKRVEVALRTLAELRARWPELTLTVAGQGYWEDELRAEAERLGVADAVHFAGHVDDVTKHRLLARAWLHLMPSVKEGWGLVVVEAAAHGTPTVGLPVRRRAAGVRAAPPDRRPGRGRGRLRRRGPDAAGRRRAAGRDGAGRPGLRGRLQLGGRGAGLRGGGPGGGGAAAAAAAAGAARAGAGGAGLAGPRRPGGPAAAPSARQRWS